MTSKAYSRSAAVWGIFWAGLAIIETLAFITKLFVPLTFVMIDGGNTTTVLPFAYTGLGGHFWPPRLRLDGSGKTRMFWLYVTLFAAAAIAFDLYKPAFAAIIGYPMGALVFPSTDRRRRE